MEFGDGVLSFWRFGYIGIRNPLDIQERELGWGICIVALDGYRCVVCLRFLVMGTVVLFLKIVIAGYR